jgi:hypothetical protein
MRVGIVGSGNMGGAIGRLLAAAGHDVVFSYARSRDKLERLARESGARAGTPAEAVRGADAVLLAVHWSRVDDALRGAGLLDGTVLVDCTLPMTDDDTALAVGHTTSGAEELARRFPAARVVKAFNMVPSELLRAGPALLEELAACCLCGNDAGAKALASTLVRDAGLEPVDAGPLRVARYLEPFALLVAQLAYEQGIGPELGTRFVTLRPGVLEED